MEQDNNRRNEPVYSKKLRAGRRRTYFFDVRPTRSNDYYLTITESKKKYNEDGYDRHKIFLYKEDFNKFIDALTETIDHVKTELLPEYDFDEFSRRYDDEDDEYKKPSDVEEEDLGSKVSERQQEVEKPEAEEPKESDKPKDAGPSTDSGSTAEEDEDLKWD